jgi:3',5'-cyclic AMP phosphodiesterase CpdA
MGMAAASLLPSAQAAPGNFTFVHLTDTHIQPEMHATEGCRMCFDQVKKSKPDFALLGGDLVFDAMDQGPDRSKKLFDLFAETAKRLDLPTHATLGNHDVYGTGPKAGVAATDPMRGKKMFEDRQGKALYHSFAHKGWHFLVLDSIEITAAGSFRGNIGAEQLAWLQSEVTKAGRMPLCVLTHIPLLSAAPKILNAGADTVDRILVANSGAVIEILSQGNLKLVLQGHTHICETVEYKGAKYITSGAVSGNWWRGQRLGFSEGYGLLRVRGEEVSWEYRTFGFQADPA